MKTRNAVVGMLTLVGMFAPAPVRAVGTLDFRKGEGKPLQSILTKVRIRPGCTERVRRFLEAFHQKPDELYEVLEDGRIFVESDFIEETANGDYLYVFKRLESIEYLKGRIANSTLPLSRRIREVLVPCVAGRRDLEAVTTFLRDE
jgi:hypothetical protein